MRVYVRVCARVHVGVCARVRERARVRARVRERVRVFVCARVRERMRARVHEIRLFRASERTREAQASSYWPCIGKPASSQQRCWFIHGPAKIAVGQAYIKHIVTLY